MTNPTELKDEGASEERLGEMVGVSSSDAIISLDEVNFNLRESIKKLQADNAKLRERNAWLEKMWKACQDDADRCVRLNSDNEDLQFEAAAMRGALDAVKDCTFNGDPALWVQVNKALSGVAGKELLEWAKAAWAWHRHPFIEDRGPFPKPPEWLK